MLIAQVVTEAEYEQALSEMRRLVALEPDRDTLAGGRLEALTSLAETFEAERFVLDLADIDAR
jgi:antitoxin component HigA of HigAB toxin-antitoxin module